MEKQVPLLPGRTLLRTWIEPPNLLIIPLATHRPRPVPCSPFVVKNGSNMRAVLFGGIPIPLSAIATLIPSLAGLFQ
jgi:hypothetical protein